MKCNIFQNHNDPLKFSKPYTSLIITALVIISRLFSVTKSNCDQFRVKKSKNRRRFDQIFAPYQDYKGIFNIIIYQKNE